MRSAADEGLRGYGQILFCGQPRSGVLVLLGTMAWPHAGIAGLMGLGGALLAGRLLPRREDLRGPGLYACNGILAGLGVGAYGPTTAAAWIVALLAGALAAAMLFDLSMRLARRHLPALSLPFVLAAWCALGGLHAMGGWRDLSRPPVTVGPPALAVGWGSAWSALHPWDALRVLGAAVFQPGVVPGLFCLAAVWIHSRRLAAMFAVAALSTHLVATSWAPRPEVIPMVALNATVAAVALAGVFVPLRREGMAVALAAAWAALVGTALAYPLADAVRLPLLVAPFNLATIAALALLRRQPTAAAPPPRMQLALPFCGRWMVSQGPDGQPTHQGLGRHAWDFVAVDGHGRTHRGLGLHAADYYAFGLPVLAPAAGVVAAVVDGVPDNVPPRENLEQNWGNLVIIDHGDGKFTEISHFQAFSIVVAAGQVVERGQVLGRCGNSGRSLEPHLHVQVQSAAYAGAPSLPARFEGFRCFTRSVPDGVLREGDEVENT